MTGRVSHIPFDKRCQEEENSETVDQNQNPVGQKPT